MRNRMMKTIIMFLASAPQLLAGGGASAAFLFHRHGSFGLHMHAIALANDDPDAGLSPVHPKARQESEIGSAEPVVVVCLHQASVLSGDESLRDTIQLARVPGCPAGASGLDSAIAVTAITAIQAASIRESLASGSALLSILQTSSALLV